MTGANFQNAVLTGVSYEGANLTGANFEGGFDRRPRREVVVPESDRGGRKQDFKSAVKIKM